MHSHLIHAIHVWSCNTASLLKELVVKLPMAIHIIHNSAYNAHTECIFMASAILILHLLTDLFKLQFMHQNKFNYLPSSLKIHGVLVTDQCEDPNQLVLCNEGNCYIPFTRLSSCYVCPLVYFSWLGNEFLSQTKSTSNEKIFKKELKSYLFLGEIIRQIRQLSAQLFALFSLPSWILP
jgi:hypothetical protein